METVEALLREKGTQVFSIQPDNSVLSAVRLMTERHVGAVLVMQEDRLLGIFTERDLMTKVVLKAGDASAAKVREVMETDLVVVNPSTPVREAMAVMTERRCRHLPVLSGGRLVGLVSIGDCTRLMSRNHQYTIQHLTDYIASKYPA